MLFFGSVGILYIKYKSISIARAQKIGSYDFAVLEARKYAPRC